MQSRQPWRFLTVAAVLVIAGIAGLARAEGEPDIHYVPTPQYVVNEMLEIAGVNKDDVVYDLGCGDGRYVITAAKKYGARGVGIDIDPERVRESQANARAAGVTDRVRFIEADLFKTDIRQATVVALYLLPSLNLKLRPTLFKDLKPGTRIVSHDFDMDDWKPDFSGQIGNSQYFFWTLPADVAGLWKINLSSSAGMDHDYTIQFTQKFQELSGRAISNETEIESSAFKLKGETVSFFLSKRISPWKVDMYFKGKVNGDSMSGTVEIEGGPFTGNHAWMAVRNK